MSAIFQTMNGLEVDTIPNYYQSVSATGFRHVEVYAPAYYELAVSMPPMYYDKFAPVQAELLEMEHGIQPFNTTIPHNHMYPYDAVGNNIVTSGSALAGASTITLSGLPVALAAGAYLQFAGGSKVYQIKKPVASGNVTVELNTILLHSPAAATKVRFGNNVVFHLQMTKRAKWNTIPGNIEPMYGFSDQLVFKEVVSRTAPVGQENVFHESWV